MEQDIQLGGEGFLHDFRQLPEIVRAGHVASIAFRPECYRDTWFEACGMVRPPQLDRALPQRRAEYLAGRVLAARCLAALELPAEQLGTGPHREPLWPKGVAGSLSHSGGIAVCAVTLAPDIFLGIDLEHIPDWPVVAQIRSQVMTRTEEDVLPLSEHDRRHFTAVFSAKESLFKAVFPHIGRYIGFEAARLVRFDPAGTLRLELAATLGPALPQGQRFDVAFRPLGDGILTLLAAQISDRA